MTRFRRLLIPLMLNLIILIGVMAFLPDLSFLRGLDKSLYTTLNQFLPSYRTIASNNLISNSAYVKLIGVLLIIIITLVLDIAHSGYFKLFTFTTVSSITSTIYISSVIYLSSGSTKNVLASILFAGITISIFSIFELRQRYVYKKRSKTCFTGLHLQKYSRTPWKYFNSDGIREKEQSVLYCYMPELSSMATKAEDKKQLLEVVNHIYEKCYSTVAGHNGVFIRRTDDNMIIFFETGIYRDKNVSEESGAAYHAISCALELKQVIRSVVDKYKNPILEHLKANIVISTGNSIVLNHLRNGRMELSLFGETLSTIENIIASTTSSEIIVDNKTNNLCSLYFRTQELSNSAVAVLGMSTWV